MTGERIKLLRQDKGLSQKELAKALSIGHSTLSCYEVCRRQVPNELIVQIALFFEVTTDYLLGLEDEFGIKCKK